MCEENRWKFLITLFTGNKRRNKKNQFYCKKMADSSSEAMSLMKPENSRWVQDNQGISCFKSFDWRGSTWSIGNYTKDGVDNDVYDKLSIICV